MSNVGLIAIMLAAFLLVIGLIRVLDRFIESDASDGWAKPPDTNGTGPADNGIRGATPGIDPGVPR
jgi:hypothetical protein